MNLICSSCLHYAPAKKQWWNQDTGYGICARCFQSVVAHETKVLGQDEGLAYAIQSYGKPGIHHSLETEQETTV